MAYRAHRNQDSYFPAGWPEVRDNYLNGEFCGYAAMHKPTGQAMCSKGNAVEWTGPRVGLKFLCAKDAGPEPTPTPTTAEPVAEPEGLYKGQDANQWDYYFDGAEGYTILGALLPLDNGQKTTKEIKFTSYSWDGKSRELSAEIDLQERFDSTVYGGFYKIVYYMIFTEDLSLMNKGGLHYEKANGLKYRIQFDEEKNFLEKETPPPTPSPTQPPTNSATQPPTGEWKATHKCPSGLITTAFDETGYSKDRAKELCAEACNDNDSCKFADLYFVNSRQVCYTRSDQCGDWQGNTHPSYSLYIKGDTETPECTGSVNMIGLGVNPKFKGKQPKEKKSVSKDQDDATCECYDACKADDADFFTITIKRGKLACQCKVGKLKKMKPAGKKKQTNVGWISAKGKTQLEGKLK